MDMTDLIARLMDEGQTVASFPVTEYWLDIGHHDDYMRAQVDIQQGRV
jgi:NDP-sugar pyrophosphorylase family protein